MSADNSNTDFYSREEMAMLAELAADGSFQGQRMPRIFRHAAVQLQNSLERSKPQGDRDFDSSESAGSGKHKNCVLMVYGIDQSRFNCDKLFNLFCVYGTCLRIKFLKAKPDTCMVEMGLPSESALIIEHLNGIELFGHKLLFQSSNQKSIIPIDEPFKMPDQSLSFVDYSNNENQRFSDVRAARKNRILPPSRQLYWFDAPPGITEHGIQKIFEMKRASTPTAVTKFNINTEKVAEYG
uniref:RRM domain-containing protein n=1 Tax=Steinernema glaseri TaxID=37863 RepID=A0A1I7ZFB9_9BILA